jgi:hypothetical protein
MAANVGRKKKLRGFVVGGKITTLKVKGDKNTYFLTHCFCYWQGRAKPSNSNFCTSKKNKRRNKAE